MEKPSRSINLFDIAARARSASPDRYREPLEQPERRILPSLMRDTFTDELSGEVFERTSHLMQTIRSLYPNPPKSTKPGEFFKNGTAHKTVIEDSDVDWYALWNAKMRQVRNVDMEELAEQIHATLASGEKMMQIFHQEALLDLRVLIEAELAGESASFEGLFQRLFYSFANRGQALTTVGEAEYLRRSCPVKDIGVMDLFAWQIPHLLPECAGRSKALGGHYWTLLSLRWLVRYHSKEELNECPPKQRSPWILMRHYAGLLR